MGYLCETGRFAEAVDACTRAPTLFRELGDCPGEDQGALPPHVRTGSARALVVRWGGLYAAALAAVRVVAALTTGGGARPTLGMKRPPALSLPGVASAVRGQGPAMIQRISTAPRSTLNR
ncbi:hypothetical protein QFZ49_005112 [Streptomyces turgidiscabies]|uniref:Uncharacterized protein n=1 Tax=Streptomyces turgidiscabies TaxID=85558 RepID=A0ABU0RT18_9ACTN|nr:hypothetical protein [Streptomyces turgidiscabies]